MDAYAQAVADFEANQCAKQCPPIVSAKQSRETVRYTQKQSDYNAVRLQNAEHNSENRRYDSEGEYYVGGFR